MGGKRQNVGLYNRGVYGLNICFGQYEILRTRRTIEVNAWCIPYLGLNQRVWLKIEMARLGWSVAPSVEGSSSSRTPDTTFSYSVQTLGIQAKILPRRMAPHLGSSKNKQNRFKNGVLN